MTSFRFVGLNITQINATSLLQMAAGRNQNPGTSVRAARDLVNFVTRWDEILLLTGSDLDELECLWAGQMRSDDKAPSSSLTEEFYVLLESRCFINSSWEITKEMTCLAISKSAFAIITTYASFQQRHRLSESLPETLRPCQMRVIRECVECLKSGSCWQVLVCAISGLLVSLCALPERKRPDYAPPVEALAFGYRRFSRVKPFIQKFLDLGKDNTTTKRRRIHDNDLSRADLRRLLNTANSNLIIINLSFQRVSERKVHNCEGAHMLKECCRCRQAPEDDLYANNLVVVQPDIISSYGAILVESPNSQNSKAATRHDLCLFVVENSPLLEEKEALPLAIEDILQTGKMYHTITHAPPKDPDSSRVLLWNLPLPYRPSTQEQRTDAMNWCQELLEKPTFQEDPPKDNIDIWSHLQMLLYFLRAGSSCLEAEQAVARFCQGFSERLKAKNEKAKALKKAQPESFWGKDPFKSFFKWIDQENGQNEDSLYSHERPLPPRLKARGDIDRRSLVQEGQFLKLSLLEKSELGQPSEGDYQVLTRKFR